jgi:nucleoside-diphosphate-sugar epimerase
MVQVHTILGAGGAIGNNLLKVLQDAGEAVRLVSRSGKSSPGVESRKANVLQKESLKEALDGSSIVYFLIGIEYKIEIWRRDWPVIMQNVIDVCGELKIPFIFVDNVYMYGQVSVNMTEATPFNPCSEKGKVRAQIATMLLDAIKSGNITATIARSADFYGPYSFEVSFYHQLVTKNIKAGKKAQWLGNPNLPHSLTYTPDAAKALYLLAKDPTSFNQTWHLPTASPALTAKELAVLEGSKKNVSAIPKWFLKILGIFVPVLKESVEMVYQYEHPYYFDSSKFQRKFNFTPTSYRQGLTSN